MSVWIGTARMARRAGGGQSIESPRVRDTSAPGRLKCAVPAGNYDRSFNRESHVEQRVNSIAPIVFVVRESCRHPGAAVILGAFGDLAMRKLIPPKKK